MILSVMQPTYLPWLGYFSLIDSSDKFVFLDNVKLEKSDWHIRNRIKTKNQALMLSCHVETSKGRSQATLENTEYTKAEFWRKKHLKSILENYSKAPYFDELYTKLLNCYANSELNTVAKFNVALIKMILDYMSIKTPTYLASDLGEIEGVKDGRLVSICNRLGCDIYLSPLGAKDYIEEITPGGELVRNGIDVTYQNFVHPQYEQQKGAFISHLSVIDCLFNVGPIGTLDLLRESTRTPIHFTELR